MSLESRERVQGFAKATQIVAQASRVKPQKPRSHVKIPDFLRIQLESPQDGKASFCPSNFPNSAQASIFDHPERTQRKRTIAEMSLAWEAHQRSKAEAEVMQATTLASDKDSFNITDLLRSGKAPSAQKLRTKFDERGKSTPHAQGPSEQISNISVSSPQRSIPLSQTNIEKE